MKNSRIVFWICVGLAALGLVVNFSLRSHTWLAGLALLFGILWGMGETGLPGKLGRALNAGWISNLCFTVVILLGAASGILQGYWWLALAVTLAALGAWDLRAYRLRIAENISIPGIQEPVLKSPAEFRIDEKTETALVPAAPGTLKSAEQSMLDRAHLSALAWTLAAGLAAALLGTAAARWLSFSAGIGTTWLLGLLVVAALLGLGKLLMNERPNE